MRGKPTRKKPLGSFRRRWKKILEWILKKWVSIRGTGLIRLRYVITGSLCESGIEPPGSISNELN